MSAEQRKRHIKKVNDSDDDTTMASSSRCKVTSLLPPSNVSSEIWERVVSKAQAIASDPTSVTGTRC